MEPESDRRVRCVCLTYSHHRCDFFCHCRAKLRFANHGSGQSIPMAAIRIFQGLKADFLCKSNLSAVSKQFRCI